MAEWLVKLFHEENIHALCIHGETSRKIRDMSLEQFRFSAPHSTENIAPTVLITTDIRGIHFQNAPLIINFDLAPSREIYMKRCGRYFGHKAIVINLIHINERNHMTDIQAYYGMNVSYMNLNSFTELALEIFKIT